MAAIIIFFISRENLFFYYVACGKGLNMQIIDD